MARSRAAWLAPLLGSALAVAPAAVRAAVEGSPHDMVAQGYDVSRGGGSQERCVACHATARAATQGLIPDVPASLRGSYGAASLVCFSCHDGVTLVAPEVDASLTAYHPGSHGHDLAAYRALQEQGGGDLPDVEGDHMECTTCHDPHDNTRRPFLRVGLGEICLRCHSPLAETPVPGVVNTSGNHPGGRDPLAVARPGMPVQTAADFTVAFPAAYPLVRGKGSAGTHWDLGGHLLKGAAGELACVTCHAVHGDESAPPAPWLLVKDPVRDLADEFCEGCHRGARGDGGGSTAAPNPGGTVTGRTYHPCDDDDANGEGRILEAQPPADWPVGGGSPARLVCTTCHRAHRAQPGTQLLRPVAAGSFCGACHDQLPPPHHHPAGRTEGQCTNLLSSAAGEPATLDCGRCHRAHNAGLGAAVEQDFVPILRASRRSDELCSTCHPPGNPTCGTTTTQMASHFLGDPALAETYDDRNPPVRTDPWPESGLLSLYGGPEGKSILCLSCHGFRQGVLLTGDDGKSGHLLARAGNPVEWAPGEEAKYLCSGCHGLRPGTGSGAKGHTHPLLNSDVAKLGVPVRAPASATLNGHINCDSCHRSHEAVTAGGVYIMEAARGANTDPMAIQPKIDFTPTCHLCHDASKY